MDGVYTADPATNSDARFLPRLGYDQVLEQKLNVMDATAIVLCRDNNIPLRVLNIYTNDAMMKLLQGEDIGTLVSNEELK